MDYTWVIGLTLVSWICELAPADSASQDWLSVPGTVWACAGDNVSLHWEYDEDLGVPKVVNVARSELTITLVSKIGSDDARSHRPRATFLPNAGVDISNVSADDSGKYESTVVFSDQHSLVDEATLVVYEACPDRQDFDKPEVYVIFSVPRNRTDLNVQKPMKDFPVHFKAKVPESEPKVNCTLYVGDVPYDCESGEAKVESGDNINVNIIVTLSHPALGESSRRITYTNGQEDTTIAPSIHETLRAGGNGSHLLPLAVIFGIFALGTWLILLPWILWKRHKKTRSTWDISLEMLSLDDKNPAQQPQDDAKPFLKDKPGAEVGEDPKQPGQQKYRLSQEETTARHDQEDRRPVVGI